MRQKRGCLTLLWEYKIEQTTTEDITEMERQYRECGRVLGLSAKRLMQALEEGRPLEFEFVSQDEIIIKAVTIVRPECRREFVSAASNIS